uniref:Uncharacterized protein LOC114344365 n=1 Tax=Diabrotica virgifera virgifera TaxID=50390 RepID=A0A6P7GM80_DIAVI
MAPPYRKQCKIILLLFIFYLSDTGGQYDEYTRYSNGYQQNLPNSYDEFGPRPPYIPNNPEYDQSSTYLYKGRRYGQNYNSNYYGQRPGDPRIRGQDNRFSYDRPVSQSQHPRDIGRSLGRKQ